MALTSIDYVIISAYLIGITSLGIYLGRGQRNTRDYFLADKHIPWWIVTGSIVATETSTLTFVSVPGIAYQANLAFLQLTLGYMVGRVIISFVLIPHYFKGELFTSYELLNRIFGSKVKNVSSSIFLVTRSLSDGVRLYLTALVFSIMIPSIGVFWSTVIMMVCTLIFTFTGGMKAVVWTDFTQLVIYVTGAIFVALTLLSSIPGGLSGAISAANSFDKLSFLDFSFGLAKEYTFWGGMLGGIFLTLSTHGTDQLMVQRYLSCDTKRHAQLSLITSGFVVFLQFSLFLFIGVLLFVFYNNAGQTFSTPDKVFPSFIVNHLPTGLAGLLIAAVFSASISTLSSSLNSLSSVTVNDFYKPYVAKQTSEKHLLAVSRFTTLGWGVILILTALITSGWGIAVEVGLTIQSITAGSVLGIFLLGIFIKNKNEWGGIIGMVSGLSVVLAIHLTGNVSWPWYSILGTLITLFVGSLISHLLNQRIKTKRGTLGK
ncbi:MAG TPA: sodium/solute symporter [Thermoplasmata archaeon]|nr:sodium/solute symporter [Thermoplasmata archaeon]